MTTMMPMMVVTMMALIIMRHRGIGVYHTHGWAIRLNDRRRVMMIRTMIWICSNNATRQRQ